MRLQGIPAVPQPLYWRLTWQSLLFCIPSSSLSWRSHLLSLCRRQPHSWQSP